MGKSGKELTPGIHRCIWFIDDISRTSAAEEFYNLPTQSIVTSDGRAVCFSMNIGVRIVSAVQFFENVQDFKDSIEAAAMPHLAKRMRGMTYEELIESLDKLEKSLRNTLETKLKRWGVEVTKVGFTDCVPVRTQIRLFQDKSPLSV